MFKTKKGIIIWSIVFGAVTALVVSFAMVCKIGIINLTDLTASFKALFSYESPEAPSREVLAEPQAQYPKCELPSLMKGVYLNTKEELDLSKSIYGIKTDLLKKAVYYKGIGINTCIYNSTGNNEIDAMIALSLKESGFYAFELYSLSSDGAISSHKTETEIRALREHLEKASPDAIVFKDYYNKISEVEEISAASEKTVSRLGSLYKAVKEVSPTVAVGVLADPVRKNADIGGSYSFEALADGFFDIEALLEETELDLVITDAPFAISNSTVSYTGFLKYWTGLVKDKKTEFYTLLHNEKLASGEAGWSNPVEIVKQVIESTKYEDYSGFVLNDGDALIKNKTTTASLVKYMNEDLDAESILKELTMIQPTARTFSTNESTILFRGTTDKNYEVLINGSPAARNENGDFAMYVNLKVGTNRISFSHKGKTITYTITRTINVLTSVSPLESLNLDGGTVLSLSAVAYREATVTATINGTKITLKPDLASSEANSLYCTFHGSYKLPEATTEAQSLGQIYYYAYFSGMSGSKYGSYVTVNKISVENVTGLLKVTNTNLPFTYSGDSTYYFPCPDQTFLPVGTIDYTVGDEFVIKDGSDVYKFIKTKAGKRYQTKDITYIPLKDMGMNRINSASASVENTYLTFKFSMNWNVPFNIQANSISYRKDNYQDFKITSFSPNKLTITFNYTDIPAEFTLPENSLFSSYVWEKGMENGEEVVKLVLSLKNSLCYTGYVTSYDDNGNLTIKFNLPLKVSSSSNEYGGDLTGSVIAISPGHGGGDPGAIGTHDKVYYERDINTAIVSKLKAELEKAGATVVICDKVTSNLPDYRGRSNQATAAGAQVHIVIHQNSSTVASSAGYEVWHYSPFSYKLGEYMREAMKAFYQNTLYGGDYKAGLDRGIYFSWISDTMYPTAPTVLLETGFISNQKECLALNSAEMQTALAKELVKGIIKYANEQN